MTQETNYSPEPNAIDPRTVTEYAAAVASGAPTPGGGSVISTVAAFAAGLTEMVCHLTLHKPADPATIDRIGDLQRRAESFRNTFLQLAHDDERAYGSYQAAVKLAKTSDDERSARRTAIQSALVEAANVPLRIARSCVDLQALIAGIAEVGTKHALSDVRTSHRFTGAALSNALDMVSANTDLMKDREQAADLDAQSAEIRRQGERAASEVEAALSKRERS